MPAGSGAEDEWEYEYSVSETETFLVDLDLSAVNGVIRSKNAGDRKSLKRPRQSTSNGTLNATTSNIGNENVNNTQYPDNNDDEGEGVDGDNGDDDGIDEDIMNDDAPGNNASEQHESAQGFDLTGNDHTDRLQVLDFNTNNPIVSYNGHVYSCAWHDMIGTLMFISKHQEAPFHEPEIATDDYDLIGTSRVKLVGKRAKVVPTTGSKKRPRDGDGEAAEKSEPNKEFRKYIPNGRSLGTITRTNPRTNIEIKQQANFLERLMERKKSCGESDVVRTFVDRHMTAADARRAQKAQNGKGKEKIHAVDQHTRREINELNKRVVKGDNGALERLQEIYAEMDEEEAENEHGQ